jgi:hypothetical protein
MMARFIRPVGMEPIARRFLSPPANSEPRSCRRQATGDVRGARDQIRSNPIATIAVRKSTRETCFVARVVVTPRLLLQEFPRP